MEVLEHSRWRDVSTPNMDALLAHMTDEQRWFVHAAMPRQLPFGEDRWNVETHFFGPDSATCDLLVRVLSHRFEETDVAGSLFPQPEHPLARVRSLLAEPLLNLPNQCPVLSSGVSPAWGPGPVIAIPVEALPSQCLRGVYRELLGEPGPVRAYRVACDAWGRNTLPPELCAQETVSLPMMNHRQENVLVLARRWALCQSCSSRAPCLQVR